MKIKILSLAFMLASACAFSQGVSVILSNAQMSGIAANGLPLATNTPTAGQVLTAADTSGLTNYWAAGGGGPSWHMIPRRGFTATGSGINANTTTYVFLEGYNPAASSTTASSLTQFAPTNGYFSNLVFGVSDPPLNTSNIVATVLTNSFDPVTGPGAPVASALTLTLANGLSLTNSANLSCVLANSPAGQIVAVLSLRANYTHTANIRYFWRYDEWVFY